MRRLPFLVFCFLFSVFCSDAQSWQNVGGGANHGIAGLDIYNGNLFAAGYFTSAGGIPAGYVAQWNGSVWDSVSTGIKYNSSGIGGAGRMAVYDSILYISGQFDTVNNRSCKSIAQWNGISWDSVGNGLTSVSGQTIEFIIMYNKKLYAGGNFQAYIGSKSFYNIAAWDGTKWDSVGMGSGTNGSVWAFTIFNGELYAGGYFTTAGGISANQIAKWDGTKWDSLGSGTNGPVWSLAVCNGKLYAGGGFTMAGGVTVNNIAVWDGVKWDSVGGGVNSGGVSSLMTYNGKLYVGGYFDTAGHKPANDIAEWDGAQWYSIGSGLTGGSYGIWCLTMYDSTLYAGGDFQKSGSTVVKNIAMWNGPVGVNELKVESEKFKVWPNPSTGVFTIEEQGVRNKERVEVYNMIGEKIYNTQLNTTTTQIDLSSQPSGVYLYRILNSNGELVQSGKMMVER